jgi:adenylate cyclase
MRLILLESQATIVVTDMLNFQQLANGISAMELGVVLSAYYEHIGAGIERHGGRIAKFVGDGVLAVFEGTGHPDRALAVVKELADARLAWLADNAKVGLPAMDYSVGVATGEVLAGEMGTDRIHFWDVIGAPVNIAFRLCALAIDRRTPNLVDAATVEGAAAGAGKRCVEVDAAELGGKRQRLFRLDA